MRIHRRIVPFALVVIALTACSSSESSTSSTTNAPASTSTSTPSSSPVTPAPTNPPSTTAPPTTAPATTAPAVTTTPPTTEAPDVEAELIALAETALVDLTVFPEGWTETPAVADDGEDDDDEDDEFERQVDECLGVGDDDDVESDLLESREARSGEFTNPDDDTQPSVEHLVTVADDTAMAIRAMERAGVDGAAGCLQDTLQAFFDADPDFQLDESGIELGDLTVTRRDLDGDTTEQVGYRVEIPLTLEGQTFVQYLDVLYQRQGRALSQLQFASFSVPFSDEGYTSLSGDVVLRLESIGG